MDTGYFFQKLDTYLERKQLSDAESFMHETLADAMGEGDTGLVLAVLSELIGLYRVTGRHEMSTMFGDKAIAIANMAGLNGTEQYATIVLNSATAYRAAGNYRKAEELYKETMRQLELSKCNDVYKIASLYNNISLLYQETGREMEAIGELKKALELIRTLPDCYVEEATTYTNMALVYIRLGMLKEAEELVLKALEIFEKDRGNEFKDSHYGAALSALGDVLYHRGKLAEAVETYDKALCEIARCYGINNNAYEMTIKNCIEACRELGDEELTGKYEEKLQESENPQKKINGLTLSRMYYEAYGKEMIHKNFPEYEDRIAVGLCGYGSDCFGFDDAFSQDHDFGPSFAMWLTDEDYDKIGEKLNECYSKLPTGFMGFGARKVSTHGKGRVGAMRISDFFLEHTGFATCPARDDIESWKLITHEMGSTAVNGEVFTDKLGLFTSIREDFKKYYPEVLYRAMTAETVVKVSHYGQYNYLRCLNRGERTAAFLALSGFVTETMKLLYLVDKKYMPYYKWAARGLRDAYSDICGCLDDLIENPWSDDVTDKIEQICAKLNVILRQKGISDADSVYLEVHADSILNKRSEENMTRDEMIGHVVKCEWDMFQATQNEGGRADCQNNLNTFTLMRKSQFMAWSDELIASYLQDLVEAAASGRNLVTEKYGRMMESTAPEKYLEIKDNFPALSDERKAISEQVIAIQVGWLEEFVEKYKGLAGQIRYVHTSEDTEFDTSAETYLRGELATYSERTFIIYCNYVVRLFKEGRNLNKMIMENSALLYGYKSLEDANERMLNL